MDRGRPSLNGYESGVHAFIGNESGNVQIHRGGSARPERQAGVIHRRIHSINRHGGRHYQRQIRAARTGVGHLERLRDRERRRHAQRKRGGRHGNGGLHRRARVHQSRAELLHSHLIAILVLIDDLRRRVHQRGLDLRRRIAGVRLLHQSRCSRYQRRREAGSRAGRVAVGTKKLAQRVIVLRGQIDVRPEILAAAGRYQIRFDGVIARRRPNRRIVRQQVHKIGGLEQLEAARADRHIVFRIGTDERLQRQTVRV